MEAGPVAHYRVFGGVLSSEIEIPELTPIPATRADWTLTRGRTVTPWPDVALVGEEMLPGAIVARLERTADAFRLHFDDTGTFEITDGGATIVWVPAPEANAELVRSDLLGRVLSIAFHAAGDLCLHGSAVALDGDALVIVGEKGHGKSTLAMALVAAGASLLADDTVRLTTRHPVQVAPGVRTLRLRADSAAHFGIDADRLPHTPGDKVVVSAPPGDEPASWRDVRGIYLLAPRAPTPGGTTVRRTLSATEATLALVRHSKTAMLLGRGEGGAVLDRAAAVARSTPVCTLDIARNLDAVADVAARIVAWHLDGGLRNEAS